MDEEIRHKILTLLDQHRIMTIATLRPEGPFMVIGSKFGFDPDSLVYALIGPHAKMNFSLRRPEADDVAAYIATLAGDGCHLRSITTPHK
jgi:hypothetical protein